MPQASVASYYRFTPLADPSAIKLWQSELGTRLGVTGRVVISAHGINASIGGDSKVLKTYVRQTRGYEPFRNIDVAWSSGSGQDFPRLSVKVRREVVAFGAAGELEVIESGIVDGGSRLNPQQVHQLVAARGEEVVFFDGRNALEAQVGRFKGAIVPDISRTRDFIPLLESGVYDDLKERPVVTYCTGGVRCEVLTSVMKRRGFTEVYQLDGGILRYGETYGDTGLWEGALYVFDGRKTVTFSSRAKTLGRCGVCEAPTSRFCDVDDGMDRHQELRCRACASGASRR